MFNCRFMFLIYWCIFEVLMHFCCTDVLMYCCYVVLCNAVLCHVVLCWCLCIVMHWCVACCMIFEILMYFWCIVVVLCNVVLCNVVLCNVDVHVLSCIDVLPAVWFYVFSLMDIMWHVLLALLSALVPPGDRRRYINKYPLSFTVPLRIMVRAISTVITNKTCLRVLCA